MSRNCDRGTNRLTDYGSCNVLITRMLLTSTHFPEYTMQLLVCIVVLPWCLQPGFIHLFMQRRVWRCDHVDVCVLMPRVPLPLKRLSLAHIWGCCAETVSMATLSLIGRPCSFRGAIDFRNPVEHEPCACRARLLLSSGAVWNECVWHCCVWMIHALEE